MYGLKGESTGQYSGKSKGSWDCIGRIGIWFSKTWTPSLGVPVVRTIMLGVYLWGPGKYHILKPEPSHASSGRLYSSPSSTFRVWEDRAWGLGFWGALANLGNTSPHVLHNTKHSEHLHHLQQRQCWPSPCTGG